MKPAVRLYELDAQVVSRAGNARIVRTHQHFQQQSDFVLVPVDNLWGERLEILLDIRVVLSGRDADVRLGAHALIIEGIAMEEDASRRLDASDAFAGLRLDLDRFRFDPGREQLIKEL